MRELTVVSEELTISGTGCACMEYLRDHNARTGVPTRDGLSEGVRANSAAGCGKG